jgi:hypothetical protein
VYGLIGVVAQVAGVRVLELGTSIQIGPLLAKTELDSSSFVVAAAHLALGFIVAAAIL